MKKILILLGVLVVALTLGTAYAESKDMSAGVYNGVTEFTPIAVASYDIGPGLALDNGVTAFDFPKIEYGAEGAAAGGLRSTTTMKPSMELGNGVTVF